MSSPAIKGQQAQIYVGVGIDRIKRLDAIANQQQSSRSAVVRQAIDFFLTENIYLIDNHLIDTSESGTRDA